MEVCVFSLPAISIYSESTRQPLPLYTQTLWLWHEPAVFQQSLPHRLVCSHFMPVHQASPSILSGQPPGVWRPQAF